MNKLSYIQWWGIVAMVALAPMSSVAHASSLVPYMTLSAGTTCGNAAGASFKAQGGSQQIAVCMTAVSPSLAVCGASLVPVAADTTTATAGFTVATHTAFTGMDLNASDADLDLPWKLPQVNPSSNQFLGHDFGAGYSVENSPAQGVGTPFPIVVLTVNVPAGLNPASTYSITLNTNAEPIKGPADGPDLSFALSNGYTVGANQTPACDPQFAQPHRFVVPSNTAPTFTFRAAASATPDLAVDVSGLPTSDTVGTVYDGTITVKNIGAAAASGNATFTITGLPPGIAPTCQLQDVASLGPNAVLNCAISGTPTAAGTYAVTATATDPADTDTVNNSATATIVIAGSTGAVNGACGSDNGQTLLAPPTNLCGAGMASAVSGSGPWTWTCAGSGGGTTASCSANKASLTATATTVTASPNPASINHAVMFGVNVDPTSTPAPTSTVTVSGGGQSCTASLVATSATTSNGSCALTFATAGSYVMTATYSGDATYAASTATLNLTVDAGVTPGTLAAPMLDRWAWLALMAGLCGLAAYRQRGPGIWRKMQRSGIEEAP